jgi:hypothetical protein
MLYYLVVPSGGGKWPAMASGLQMDKTPRGNIQHRIRSQDVIIIECEIRSESLRKTMDNRNISPERHW